jgi:hypothetical protein
LLAIKLEAMHMFDADEVRAALHWEPLIAAMEAAT